VEGEAVNPSYWILVVSLGQVCAEHDLGHRVDVGVLYTAHAAAEWPGGAAELEEGIAEEFDSSSLPYQGANEVFANSGVPLRFHLVTLHQMAWNEDGPADTWHSQVCDSGPATVMREIYGADLVVAYVSSDICAAGHVLHDFLDCAGDSNNISCAIVNYSPAVGGIHPCSGNSVYGNFTLQLLGNMIGFGANYVSPGIFDYSLPYCDTTAPLRFHTSDDSDSSGCLISANLLSSPLLSYRGEPAGDVGRDNVRTANQTRLFVSRYRDQVHCPADHDADGTVGLSDLLIVEQEWDEQGIVRWLEVLLMWGPCPS
jgi:hypothetical protein